MGSSQWRVRDVPVGTGYAAWAGIGATGTALIGMTVLGEASTAFDPTSYVGPDRLMTIQAVTQDGHANQDQTARHRYEEHQHDR